MFSPIQTLAASSTPDFRSVDHPWVASARDDMLQSNPVRDEGIVVSTQVSYVGEGGRLFGEGDLVRGSASVVSNYLNRGMSDGALFSFI